MEFLFWLKPLKHPLPPVHCVFLRMFASWLRYLVKAFSGNRKSQSLQNASKTKAGIWVCCNQNWRRKSFSEHKLSISFSLETCSFLSPLPCSVSLIFHIDTLNKHTNTAIWLKWHSQPVHNFLLSMFTVLRLLIHIKQAKSVSILVNCFLLSVWKTSYNNNIKIHIKLIWQITVFTSYCYYCCLLAFSLCIWFRPGHQLSQICIHNNRQHMRAGKRKREKWRGKQEELLL